jgi:diguanylate cyclase (GGDEF)-like protein
MNGTHRRERLVSFGLVAVLLFLAACSIGTTLIIRHTSLQASEAVHMSDLYQQAHYALSTEDAGLNEYTLIPGVEGLAEFRAAAQQMNASLQAIVRDGDAGDRAFVQLVLPKQAHYLVLADQFIPLVDAHHLTGALTLYNQKITPLFGSLDHQIATAAQEDHLLAVQSLANSQSTQKVVIVFTALAFVIGLFLLMVFWRVMHGYRRQLNEATQAELLRMQQAALTDPLTGLPNHGAIIMRIETELLHCQSSQRNCAIIFVDVDHFKRINDTWGHAAGDAALHTVGQRLHAGIRKHDYIGRYGGEEFAILLSDIDQSEALDLAERLRCSIAETPCLWQQAETQSVIPIPLTASFGVATYPLDGLSARELLDMADTAMYTAKHTGRNRVCLPDDERNMAPLTGDKNQQPPQYSEQSVLQTISTMAAFHDQDTQAHANRMIRLAEATMQALGRSQDEIVLLRLAAQVHDIGKIGIPEAILQKPGPLTRNEWAVMRRHPQIGQQILTQAKGHFGLVSHIVVAHHERWDGEGYPYGLAQQEIPLGARLLSVIDTYDAMTSARPYRQALSRAAAREELQRCAGTQLDPQVVDAFLQVLHTQEPQESIVSASASL